MGGRVTVDQEREFNESFAIIDGFAEILMESEPLPEDAVARLALEAIRRNAAHARKLVRVG